VGRASAVVRKERITGRDRLEGCGADVGGQLPKGKAGLAVVVSQSHLSL